MTIKQIFGHKIVALILAIYLVLTIIWVLVTVLVGSDSSENIYNKAFTVTYGGIALIGGLYGLFSAKRWGGMKSLLGKAIIIISIGLLLQEFGQLAYTYYIYIAHNADVPYPSIGDIGYYGSVLAYVVGALALSKALGIKLSRGSAMSKIVAIALPAALLATSYFVFLKDYDSSQSTHIQVFLDFGYPLTQALYVSIALLTYLLTRKLLGGVMRMRVLLLLAAFVVQYFADSSFLYQVQNESWHAGGWNDFVYMTSYTVMALAIIYISAGFGSKKRDASAENQQTRVV